MAINYDELRRTGIYTVYDKNTLTDIGAVVDLSDMDGVHSIYQWELTNARPDTYALIKGRAWDDNNKKWSDWKEVGNPPSPSPIPPATHPGKDPGDGMWKEIDFMEYPLRGGSTAVFGIWKGTGQVLTKPCFYTYDASAYWMSPNPEPDSIKLAYLVYHRGTASYVWATIDKEITDNNIALTVFTSYIYGDYKKGYIAKRADAPEEITTGAWYKANQQYDIPVWDPDYPKFIFNYTVPPNRMLYLYDNKSEFKTARLTYRFDDDSTEVDDKIKANSTRLKSNFRVDDL